MRLENETLLDQSTQRHLSHLGPAPFGGLRRRLIRKQGTGMRGDIRFRNHLVIDDRDDPVDGLRVCADACDQAQGNDAWNVGPSRAHRTSIPSLTRFGIAAGVAFPSLSRWTASRSRRQ